MLLIEFTLFTIIICSFALVLSSSVVETSSDRIYTIYHNLGEGSFLSRGNVIKLSTEKNTISIQSFPDTETESCVDNVCEVEKNEKEKFDNLVLTEGLYQLKLVDEMNGNEIFTSVPSCSVLRSNFREEMTLHLSSSADLLSVSYRPLISSLAPKSCESLSSKRGVKGTSLIFNTTILYETSTPAMGIPLLLPSNDYRPPPGIQFLPNFYSIVASDEEKKKIGGGQPGESQQKSFFQKYWFIILMVAIMSLSGGGAPPPENEQEQQTGSGASAGAAIDAGTKVRRGKRN